ncbi:MAG: hypothetical protein JOZ22_16280, partial [Acidobacteriia bacterium]|nr:hypothetical protein [Terriglobia bacterium]
MSTPLRQSPRIVVLFALAGIGHAQSQLTGVLAKHCVTCHNEKLKTGGLIIDPAGATSPSQHPEVWEKVVRQLRTRAMPPAGMPRPDEPTYRLAVSALETELD